MGAVNILGIDGATRILSLTLQKGEEYFQYNADRGFRHSELVMPGVDHLFGEAGLKPEDLDLVCASLGPGSFTGLRVGMATAKGICAGTGAPLVAVPTLDILARPFVLFDGVTVPVIDARKQRVFCALYRRGERLADYADLTPEELFSSLDAVLESGEPVIFTGPDSPLLASSAEGREDRERFRFDGETGRSGGLDLLALGLRLFRERGADCMDAGPLYLRKSEAEISLEEKNGKGVSPTS
jgi:tRNA threonylcarbamoyladenosine biosynthesis protein TsaB